jgi:hypothetical protein
VESHFQEEVLGSKEKSPPKPDFGEYTYKCIVMARLSSQGLRIESEHVFYGDSLKEFISSSSG